MGSESWGEIFLIAMIFLDILGLFAFVIYSARKQDESKESDDD